MTDETKAPGGPQEEPAAPAKPIVKNPLEDRIVAAFGDAVRTSYNIQGELEIRIPASSLISVCNALRGDAELPCDYLRNLTAVDWKDRFEMVYNIANTKTMTSLVVKCDLDRTAPSLPSVTGIWPGANWLEREVFDLFGISFPGHPDLRRIMLPDEWEGHPLRKDYKMPED